MISGEQLLQARKKRNWEQAEAAQQLGISQPYLSLLEKGKRPLTKPLANRVVKVYDLSPIALPFEQFAEKLPAPGEKQLAAEIAALGYPKLAHLKRSGRQKNPAEVLLTALSAKNLDARLRDALPWIVFNFAELDWRQLIKLAKINDLQNRLGFIVSLARRLAEKTGDKEKVKLLRSLEDELSLSRLYREDTLCSSSMTDAERTWLETNRPPEARFWRLLTDLDPEHLDYAK
jgi:transcriptional regulator with XRE-family HTH domain